MKKYLYIVLSVFSILVSCSDGLEEPIMNDTSSNIDENRVVNIKQAESFGTKAYSALFDNKLILNLYR